MRHQEKGQRELSADTDILDIEEDVEDSYGRDARTTVIFFVMVILRKHFLPIMKTTGSGLRVFRR